MQATPFGVEGREHAPLQRAAVLDADGEARRRHAGHELRVEGRHRARRRDADRELGAARDEPRTDVAALAELGDVHRRVDRRARVRDDGAVERDVARARDGRDRDRERTADRQKNGLQEDSHDGAPRVPPARTVPAALLPCRAMSRTRVLESLNHGVLRITLNRPERKNAFDETMWREARDALADAQADDAVRTVIVTGAGESFSAGQDLGQMAAPPTGE